MITRCYGLLELTAKKNDLVGTYGGSMSSRLEDVEDKLCKLLGSTLGKRLWKAMIKSGGPQYCLVLELPRANAPKLFDAVVTKMKEV